MFVAMLGSHKNNLCLGLARMIGGFDTIALHQLSDCNNLLLFPQITYTSAKRKIKRLVSPTIFFMTDITLISVRSIYHLCEQIQNTWKVSWKIEVTRPTKHACINLYTPVGQN